MVGEFELDRVEGGKGHGISSRGALPLRSRKVVAHLRGECKGGGEGTRGKAGFGRKGRFRPGMGRGPTAAGGGGRAEPGRAQSRSGGRAGRSPGRSRWTGSY